MSIHFFTSYWQKDKNILPLYSDCSHKHSSVLWLVGSLFCHLSNVVRGTIIWAFVFVAFDFKQILMRFNFCNLTSGFALTSYFLLFPNKKLSANRQVYCTIFFAKLTFWDLYCFLNCSLGVGDEEFHSYVQDVLKATSNDGEGYTLSTANRLFIDKRLSLLESYVLEIEANFTNHLVSADFTQLAILVKVSF